MAFPRNGVLDDFNRADAASLGANWTEFFSTGASSGNQSIISNQLYQQHGGFSNYTGMYWNPSTFGADCEAYLTIATKWSNVSNDDPAIYARVKDPGDSTYDGYSVSPKGGLNTIGISRQDNGVGTQLGATVSQTISTGHKFGIEIIGSTIRAYYDTGSGWVNLVTRTDTTYPDAGYLGFYLPGNVTNGRWDDFGGGTITTPTITYILTKWL